MWNPRTEQTEHRLSGLVASVLTRGATSQVLILKFREDPAYMVAHAWNPSTWEAEARDLPRISQPEIQSET